MSKVLVVTGGGRGIGHCTAVGAAARGWDVCINYAGNAERAEQTAAMVRAAGARAITVRADVTDESAAIGLFERCDRELGVLGGLVNSAGIAEPYGRVEELRGADLAPLWNLNIGATLICIREAVRRMSTKNGGSGGAIVNLSSAASRIGAAGYGVPYAASKGAVDSLTWGVAQEVVGEGIRVNAVTPGVIDTEIQPPGRVAEIGPQLPMGRAGRPEEVANAILWLLSDEASYVAGANLLVSGAR
jgi:NAD(P)-dependent dehydrogenase (short-subunit alcohol dehydrogenase family)